MLKSSGPKSVYFSNPEVCGEIRRIARESGKTLTATVDELLKDYLARKTTNKPQR
mgnify:CR=1 FL=1